MHRDQAMSIKSNGQTKDKATSESGEATSGSAPVQGLAGSRSPRLRDQLNLTRCPCASAAPAQATASEHSQESWMKKVAAISSTPQNHGCHIRLIELEAIRIAPVSTRTPSQSNSRESKSSSAARSFVLEARVVRVAWGLDLTLQLV